MHSLFTFVILSSLVAWVTPSCILSKEWNIYVTTNIKDVPVVAHIKSGDVDLGNHTIPVYKANYNWSFCERVDGHTLFYGYFWWGSNSQNLALFDNHIRSLCDVGNTGVEHCHWSVNPIGFSVSKNADGPWNFIKGWA